MITMPISEYPTSSDPISRAQAMSERKSEINVQMQNVGESSLPKWQKDAIKQKLNTEKASLSQNIRRSLNEQQYKKKLESKIEAKKVLTEKQLSKQSADTHRLDKKA
jgi:vacuolar-type H+-ATPase catalytic subunit A/Vma1